MFYNYPGGENSIVREETLRDPAVPGQHGTAQNPEVNGERNPE